MYTVTSGAPELRQARHGLWQEDGNMMAVYRSSSGDAVIEDAVIFNRSSIDCIRQRYMGERRKTT
jgi:hypothetical protein